MRLGQRKGCTEFTFLVTEGKQERQECETAGSHHTHRQEQRERNAPVLFQQDIISEEECFFLCGCKRLCVVLVVTGV